MFEPIPVTDRILALREIYRKSPVALRMKGQLRENYYSASRFQTLYFLEGWEKYRSEPTTLLRRARAEAEVLYRSRPILEEGELLTGQPDFLPFTPEEQARYDRLQEAFTACSPFMDRAARRDHLALDYEKLLRVGVNGLVREIRDRLASLPDDTPGTVRENTEKREFYTGCLIELDALLDYASRYAREAERQAAVAENPARRRELADLAEVLRRVPAEPAGTFYEAVESVHFYTFSLFGLHPLGRPDRYLLPFYEADLSAGRLDRALAQELIDSLCLLMATYIRPDLANSLMVGGTLPDGTPVENDLTWMFLTAADHIRMPDPGTALCVSEKTDEGLLRYAVSLLARGVTHPAIYNDDELRAALLAAGCSPEDSCNYINTTCAEITVIGKSNLWTTCPYHNALRYLEEVLRERQDFADTEDLFAAYGEKLRLETEAWNRRFDLLYLERSRSGADPLRSSCLVDDCLRTGKSLAQGGAVYNGISPSYVGLPNAADCFAAIEKLVFKEKRLSLSDLVGATARDFQGDEAILSLISRSPRYGNDLSEADVWMRRITDKIWEICSGAFNIRGGPVLPGVFCFDRATYCGAEVGATPDGRRAGAPLADGVGAVQGRDLSGPTAALNSATSWDHRPFLGGVVMNLKLRRDLMTEEKQSIVAALIRSYLSRGGQQLQISAVDLGELEDAVKHPEAHRDLLVRVGGYSDWFVRLTPEIQREVISRSFLET